MNTKYQIKLAMLLLVSILAACNTKVKKENEALKAEALILKQENDAMRAKNMSLETSVINYKSTLKEIDDNLKAVDANATIVGKIGKEGSSDTSQKETILSRINSIKLLLDNSKLKIIALDKNLKELRIKFGEQSKEVLDLSMEIKAQTRLILEKETEFLILKGEMEEDISELQFAYDQQLVLTKELGAILNRGFYFVGSSKELKEKGIVDIEGGFIGIGRVKVLNANSKDGLFNQIKKDQTDTIAIVGKLSKIITEHDTASYIIEVAKTESKLIINDKAAFWKNSNYLVIESK